MPSRGDILDLISTCIPQSSMRVVKGKSAVLAIPTNNYSLVKKKLLSVLFAAIYPGPLNYPNIMESNKTFDTTTIYIYTMYINKVS